MFATVQNICHDFCPNVRASRAKVLTWDSQTKLLFLAKEKKGTSSEITFTLSSVSLCFKMLFQKGSMTQEPNLHQFLGKEVTAVHMTPGKCERSHHSVLGTLVTALVKMSYLRVK